MHAAFKSSDAELLAGLREIGPGLREVAAAVRAFPAQTAQQIDATRHAFDAGQTVGMTKGAACGCVGCLLLAFLWRRARGGGA